jgi:hypothetical protein
MARIDTGKQIFEIPDCLQGGNHQTLLRRTLKGINDDELNESVSTPCRRCNQDVVAHRDPNNGAVTVSLEEIPQNGFGGM